jgi:hypothetical protein
VTQARSFQRKFGQETKNSTEKRIAASTCTVRSHRRNGLKYDRNKLSTSFRRRHQPQSCAVLMFMTPLRANETLKFVRLANTYIHQSATVFESNQLPAGNVLKASLHVHTVQKYSAFASWGEYTDFSNGPTHPPPLNCATVR